MNFRGMARAVFQRFPDDTMERRYRHEQRSRQTKFTRTIATIGLALTLIQWVIVLLSFQASDAQKIITDQVGIVAVLLFYIVIVGWDVYLDAVWIDFIIMLAILPFLVRESELVTSTGRSGWPLNAYVTYIFEFALLFACLSFAVAVKTLLASVVVMVAVLIYLLSGRGYGTEIVLYTVQLFASFAAMLWYLNWAIDDKARSLFAARVSLDAERQKSERLLTNMLPAPIADRLKSNEAIADPFADIVVLFVDLVGFTPLSQQLGPKRIVELLNAFFERADRGADLFGMEKVKTIGDAYMAVAGALTQPPLPAKAAVDFAVWLRGEAHKVGLEFGVDLRLHVGIASGPAIGGVTGTKRLSYDYWGHTVNLAARLQDSVGADGIAVSEAVWRTVRDCYPFKGLRVVALKGVGATHVYDVDLALD